MINFNKNNLNISNSPYLNQHLDNPIHWQEWSKEVLAYARENNKPLFVSIGYSTCHWCHVMASEAFSDSEVAKILNENFVPIKVDREERPDIDKFAMDFLVETQGTGGWPLNIFMSPDLKPFFAGTYFPVESDKRLGFTELLKKLVIWYKENKTQISNFKHQTRSSQSETLENIIRDRIDSFDLDNGGFGKDQKFPPHSALLFLMNYFQETKDPQIAKMILKTLDAISQNGLHDHLHGGFFRYTVDDKWQIPHFEKMLYDQAMHLWVYSLAYKLFFRKQDKETALKIINCLEETFKNPDGLYFTALDADTDHVEGETYLWTESEIKQILTKVEFNQFKDAYNLENNFEGKIHLTKKSLENLPAIESKLLNVRSERVQPFRDEKLLTHLNAILGVSFIHAFRYLDFKDGLSKSETIFKYLFKNAFQNGDLSHVIYANSQKGVIEYLEDYASLALLTSYLYEETGNFEEEFKFLTEKLKNFKNNDDWIMTKNGISILSDKTDVPIPSGISLAELALLRYSILFNEDQRPNLRYEGKESSAFYNLVTNYTQGNLYELHLPTNLDWKNLPINSIQIKDKNLQICINKSCTNFKNLNELKISIASKL